MQRTGSPKLCRSAIYVLIVWSSPRLADCNFSILFRKLIEFTSFVFCNVESSEKMISIPDLDELTIAIEKDDSQLIPIYSIVLPQSPSRFPLTGGVPPMPNRLSTQQNVAVFAIGSAGKQRRWSLFEMRRGFQGLCNQATQQIESIAS